MTAFRFYQKELHSAKGQSRTPAPPPGSFPSPAALGAQCGCCALWDLGNITRPGADPHPRLQQAVPARAREPPLDLQLSAWL